MGLDYTSGCVNFRDVGAFINLISAEEIMPEGRILRGGSIDYVEDIKEIESPASIINLRNGHDRFDWELDYYHFPMANKVEKYHTSQKEVRAWLNGILVLFEEDTLQYPVLIHCLSGKDRTGIVIAMILKVLEIPNAIIIEEYMLSDGEVQEVWIMTALDGFEDMARYFRRIDLLKVRRSILF